MSRIRPDRFGEAKARTSEKREVLSRAGLSLWVIRRGRSFANAGRGLLVLLLTEFHFRVHLCAGAAAILLGFIFQISLMEWFVLILTIAAVLVAEAFNSALERLVDLVQPEEHALARDAKDLAAGAVLLASIAAVVIGAIIFLPPLYRLFSGFQR